MKQKSLLGLAIGIVMLAACVPLEQTLRAPAPTPTHIPSPAAAPTEHGADIHARCRYDTGCHAPTCADDRSYRDRYGRAHRGGPYDGHSRSAGL